MSKERIFSAALLVVCTALAIVNIWVMLAVVTAFAIGGLYEFFYLVKKKGIPIYSYTGILFGAAIPVYTFFRFNNHLDDNFFFVLFGLFFIFVLQFIRQNTKDAVVGMATTLFGILYISWLFSFLIKIRFIFPGVEGAKLVAFAVLVTKISDVGALLVGVVFGKHPLLASVSPKKTIEGSVGAVLFSAVTALLAQGLLPAPLQVSPAELLLLGVCLSVIGQFGDLAESVIKRDCSVKDSGKMLPAIGGVLDAIDSLLFSAPCFYFYVTLMLKGA